MKRKFKRFFSFFLIVVFSFFNLTSCNILEKFGKDDEDAIECTEISVSESDIMVKEGEYYQLRATKYPSDATSNVVWRTSDSSIATVDNTGNVYGVSEGTAYINVSCDDVTERVCVEVYSERTNLIAEILDDTITYGEHDYSDDSYTYNIVTTYEGGYYYVLDVIYYDGEDYFNLFLFNTNGESSTAVQISFYFNKNETPLIAFIFEYSSYSLEGVANLNYSYREGQNISFFDYSGILPQADSEELMSLMVETALLLFNVYLQEDYGEDLSTLGFYNF